MLSGIKFYSTIFIMATQKTLLEETLLLLDKDKRNLMQLSKEAGVGYFWITRLKKRGIPNPGIVHVEKLHAVLKAAAL